MVGVLEKQLAQAIDRRLAVFRGHLLNEQPEAELNAMAYIISELVQPCCCMLCNKSKLRALLGMTKALGDKPELAEKLAELVYNDLARCNGLG